MRVREEGEEKGLSLGGGKKKKISVREKLEHSRRGKRGKGKKLNNSSLGGRGGGRKKEKKNSESIRRLAGETWGGGALDLRGEGKKKKKEVAGVFFEKKEGGRPGA